MSFVAVVPTIGEAPQLHDLVNVLKLDRCEQTWLTVNKRGAVLPVGDHIPGVGVVYLDGSIYAGWNFGIANARANGVSRLAVLNDDIALEPGAIIIALKLMDENPDVGLVGLDYHPGRRARKLRRVSGSYRCGGIGGWAFILDITLPVDCDDSYEWWYGDDDLFMQVEETGRHLAIADGCHAIHFGETTARNYPWVEDAKERDRARFEARWGSDE